MAHGGRAVVEFAGTVIKPHRKSGRPRIRPDTRTVLKSEAVTLYRCGLTHKELAQHFHGRLNESDLLSVVRKRKSNV